MKETSVMTQPMMTSLEIAELTGKMHRHVMRSIRNMEPGWQKVTESKFGLSGLFFICVCREISNSGGRGIFAN